MNKVGWHRKCSHLKWQRKIPSVFVENFNITQLLMKANLNWDMEFNNFGRCCCLQKLWENDKEDSLSNIFTSTQWHLSFIADLYQKKTYTISTWSGTAYGIHCHNFTISQVNFSVFLGTVLCVKKIANSRYQLIVPEIVTVPWFPKFKERSQGFFDAS